MLSHTHPNHINKTDTEVDIRIVSTCVSPMVRSACNLIYSLQCELLMVRYHPNHVGMTGMYGNPPQDYEYPRELFLKVIHSPLSRHLDSEVMSYSKRSTSYKI